MRVIVVGLGVQGEKRIRYAGADCVATVDNLKPADYQDAFAVPLNDYDAALVCTPDAAKYELLEYLLSHGKHVLVEKPLLCHDEQFVKLQQLAVNNKVICYVAYNHRFEPHVVKLKNLLAEQKLGEIYHCRLFYGNGTAQLVKDSLWRDSGAGVLPDLGSHLLDLLFYWFDEQVLNTEFKEITSSCYENRSPDHMIFASCKTRMFIEAEVSLLSWRNDFNCDIYGKHGSAHISSLCKWGPATFIHRTRVLPSGRPLEVSHTIVENDPSWQQEYSHFKDLCKNKQVTDSLVVSQWIYQNLSSLSEKL